MDELARKAQRHARGGLLQHWIRVLLGSAARIDRAAALSLYDRQLGLKNRLAIADEFLALAEPGGFAAAAIEDAAAFIVCAELVQLDPVPRSPLIGKPRWVVTSAVLVVTALIAWLASRPGVMTEHVEISSRESGEKSAERISVAQTLRNSLPTSRPNPVPEIQPSQTAATPSSADGERSRQGISNAMPMSNRSMNARPENTAGSPSGRSASASLAMSQEKSRDTSSAPGAGASNAADDESPSMSAPSATSSNAAAGSPSARTDTDASRSGAGAMARDSGDSGAESENEQPAKLPGSPPSSSGPPADNGSPGGTSGSSEGRSASQSGLKRSRGVASMVLGVPMPDRVDGTLNAGRTRVTRVETSPQSSAAESVQATARAPRDTGIGTLSHPQLTPAMQRVIETYFRRATQSPPMKQQPKQQPTPQPTPQP